MSIHIAPVAAGTSGKPRKISPPNWMVEEGRKLNAEIAAARKAKSAAVTGQVKRAPASGGSGTARKVSKSSKLGGGGGGFSAGKHPRDAKGRFRRK